MTMPVEPPATLGDRELDAATGGAGADRPVPLSERSNTAASFFILPEVDDEVIIAARGIPERPMTIGRAPTHD